MSPIPLEIPNLKKNFTLLEIIITTLILTLGAIGITKALSAGLFAYKDFENINLALNIARTKMEELKNTPFKNLSDSGPIPDEDFPNFKVKVDIEEKKNPCEVIVEVSWGSTEEEKVTLTTLIADY
jgi:Tfp pilus assembly protein PilV